MLSVKVLTMFAKIQNLKNKYTLNEAQIRYAFNNLFHEMLSLYLHKIPPPFFTFHA